MGLSLGDEEEIQLHALLSIHYLMFSDQSPIDFERSDVIGLLIMMHIFYLQNDLWDKKLATKFMQTL